MKRSFYTLLVATALTLPAAGVMAQTGPLSGTASPAATGVDASANTSVDTTAGSVARSTGTASGETGVGIQSGASLATGAGTGEAPTAPAAPATAEAPAAATATATTEAAPAAPAAPATETPAEPSVNANTTVPADATAPTPAEAATAVPAEAPAATTAEAPAPEATTEMTAAATAKAATHKPDLSKATVMKIQESLNAQGLLKSRADGVWGPRTAKALRQYQNANGLKASGKVDADTLNKLGLAMSAGTASQGHVTAEGAVKAAQ